MGARKTRDTARPAGSAKRLSAVGAAGARTGVASPYAAFAQIDGRHDFRQAVPYGFVDYQVRTRHGGKLAYFNYALAREMGLIPKDHPSKMTAALERAVLDTFSLQIINEYDQFNHVRYPKADIREHPRMATRYLQLQHPDKTGRSSGDGRSIWNGQVRHAGVSWDISSCGTGATRLSPATAIEGRHFKTGDRQVAYGDGTADLEDGLGAAILSEIFHRNGVPTERTLAVLAYEGGTSINVRAGRSLLRPSHFFLHLKQGNHEGLQSALDYFIDRQEANGAWPATPPGPRRYETLALRIADTFARVTALYEAEYIFCWLDWDGDNILADGGIIDYGSVRQFGLFHHEYRYDDDERWSTTLPEQKSKARYLVQTFAQARDFVVTGRKSPIQDYRDDPAVRRFDEKFELYSRELLLRRVGFPQEACAAMARRPGREFNDFQRLFSYFERAMSARPLYKTADGITRDALYCMRDVLRELPAYLLKNGMRAMPPDVFQDLALSSYATRRDRALNPVLTRKIRQFQAAYVTLFGAAARATRKPAPQLMAEARMRASVINRAERITGDSAIYAADSLARQQDSLSFDERNSVIEEFLRTQVFTPAGAARKDASQASRPPAGSARSAGAKPAPRKLRERAARLLQALRRLVATHREGV